MAIQNRVGLGTQERKKPMGTLADLKKAMTEISYGIFKAQDAVIKLHSMGVLAYDGAIVADLEAKLGLVEQAQDGLERELNHGHTRSQVVVVIDSG